MYLKCITTNNIMEQLGTLRKNALKEIPDTYRSFYDNATVGEIEQAYENINTRLQMGDSGIADLFFHGLTYPHAKRWNIRGVVHRTTKSEQVRIEGLRKYFHLESNEWVRVSSAEFLDIVMRSMLDSICKIKKDFLIYDMFYMLDTLPYNELNNYMNRVKKMPPAMKYYFQCKAKIHNNVQIINHADIKVKYLDLLNNLESCRKAACYVNKAKRWVNIVKKRLQQ